MKNFDKDQLRAIEAENGHFLVLAPPGCGKTDILAERIARAYSMGMPFDDMLCLTFTNRASRGMRERVQGRVGDDSASMFVGNIHRYCSRLIFDETIVSENVSIIDEDDQNDLFINFDRNFFSNKNGSVNKDQINAVTNLAAYIDQTNKGHDEKVKIADVATKTLYKRAKKCEFNLDILQGDNKGAFYAIQYLAYKEKRCIIDFDDILIKAYDYMLNYEHKRYKWILVDEIQDLNYLQLAIIDQLTAKDATVMYLGDEQQAIFSFMGAKLALLGELKERCKGNILMLGNNYRAPSYLLEICNDYAVNELGVDPQLLPRAVNDSEKGKFDLVLTENVNTDDEYKRIPDMVKHYLKIDNKGKLAILVSKNKDADEISHTLDAEGIDNFKISGADMFKTRSFKTLGAIFSVIANEYNMVAWSHLLSGFGVMRSLAESRELTAYLRTLMMTPCDLMTDETYLQRFYRHYSEEEMVMFDTETTGLNVFDDEIVQIAAFKVLRGEKVPGSDFDIIMHTDKDIPAKLGAIDNPLVERYKNTQHYSREDGMRMFMEYAKGCKLLGHNVMYDYRILQNNVKKTLGLDIEFDVYDSLHVIKLVHPTLRSYKLESLVGQLRLEGKNSHLANEDIEATKSLVDYCMRMMQPIISRQREFLAKPKIEKAAKKMSEMRVYINTLKSVMYKQLAELRYDLAYQLKLTYKNLVKDGIIKDLGRKFDVFLRFVDEEWMAEDRKQACRISMHDQICKRVYDITTTLNEGDLVNKDLLSDRVYIMTVYKGKGLEFDNVVVLGAINGTYPFYKVNQVLSSCNSTSKEYENAKMMRKEDARKFYVALSRAKRRLCISYSRYNAFGRPAGLTPFMQSIKHHFDYFQGSKRKQ